jgi:hypothetical protein
LKKVNGKDHLNLKKVKITRKKANLFKKIKPRIKKTLKYDSPQIADRFEQIKKSSGILTINGRMFTDVLPDQLQVVAELGEGTCGTVSKCQYKGRALAVKVSSIIIKI